MEVMVASNDNKNLNLSDPDDYWPFPDDLDEFEREIEESLKDYEVVPDPYFEAKKRYAEETARRTRASKHPGLIPEELERQLPPGLLAYCRGEAPTPYTDPTGWAEFIEANAPFQEPWRAPEYLHPDRLPPTELDTPAAADGDA